MFNIRAFFVFAGLLFVFSIVYVSAGDNHADYLVMWYDRPAEKWVEALPVGNGRIGAMVFGGVVNERIQLNEDSIWAGGPYDPSNPEALKALPRVRRLVFDEQFDEAYELANSRMMSKPRSQVSYQPLGDLNIEFDHPKPFTGYRRQLDLKNAVSSVYYRTDRVNYKREIFASYPDQVIVMRVTADKGGRISFSAAMSSPQRTAVEASGSSLVINGKAEDAHGIEARVNFLGKVVFDAKGGSVKAEGGKIIVSKADSVVVKIAAATNYKSFKDLSGDPGKLVDNYLGSVSEKSYDKIRADHIADYRNLFGRVQLDLGSNPLLTAFPTDQRLKAFANTHDSELVSLFFQYGRYLMISASRPGDQPANLQGIWNEKLRPPWNSKYTTNINVEMNYWVAEKLNLSECHLPLLQMVKELSESGSRVAKVNYNARGWVTHHNTDGWRAAGPIDGAHWGLWPTGGAWLSMHLWDHYDFNGDREYLADVYPVMKRCALFFVDTLVEHPKYKWLVTCPSLSPEMAHPAIGNNKARSICAGPAMDNQLLRDLFEACIKSGEILGVDTDFRETLQNMRGRLAPDQIGKGGQLQEWLEDWDMDTGKWMKHRHVSHLYGLFPSSQINFEETPQLVKAAKKSLEMRGDEGTGWSLGWKINLWARLRDGEHAYKMIRQVFRFCDDTGHGGGGGSYANLFGACPPFQIDSNFGAPSGICEMLMQSYRGRIVLLPAIPSVWPEGSVKGLRARGGFEVDIDWENGSLKKTTVKSLNGNSIILACNGKTTEFETEKGKSYVFDGNLK